MRRALAVMVGFAVVVGVAGASFGAAVEEPCLVLQGGLASSVLPGFDAGVLLGVGYECDEFIAASTTTVTVLPAFALYEEANLSFSPREIEIGVDLGLSVVPFQFDIVNVWAATRFATVDFGGEPPVYFFSADAVGTLWLGEPFGGEVSVDLELSAPTESTTATLTSRTSIIYDSISGLAGEEALRASVAFDRPALFAGAILAEDDMTALVSWAEVRLRLDSNGFSVPAVILGVSLRVESPTFGSLEE